MRKERLTGHTGAQFRTSGLLWEHPGDLIFKFSFSFSSTFLTSYGCSQPRSIAPFQNSPESQHLLTSCCWCIGENMGLFSWVIVDFLTLWYLVCEQTGSLCDPGVKLLNNGSCSGAFEYSTSTEAYFTFFTRALFPEVVESCTSRRETLILLSNFLPGGKNKFWSWFHNWKHLVRLFRSR